MKHWANKYIGVSWVSGGKDMAGFDCWGLVRYCQSEHYGNYLPEVDIESIDKLALITSFKEAQKSEDWLLIENDYQDGDCVLLSSNSDPVHIGIIIETNNNFGVLHSQQGCGVIYTKMSDLEISGWRTKRVYRWNK